MSSLQTVETITVDTICNCIMTIIPNSSIAQMEQDTLEAEVDKAFDECALNIIARRGMQKIYRHAYPDPSENKQTCKN